MSQKSLLRSILVSTVTLILLPGCGEGNPEMSRESEGSADLQEGSPCDYDSFPGHVRITRIAKTDASRAQKEVVGGPGYEGYEVWFRFAPVEPILTHADFSGLLEREHLLTLRNGWYPGPRYLEKYGLEPDKEISSVLKIIRTGVCQPTMFELDGIEAADYFETIE